jgi:hypothetical protein
MSRGDGSYHGEFTVDYTDYNIDYYSCMEGMGDNFDYMSKVDKKHYIDDNFDYMSKVDKKYYIDDNFDYMSKVDKKHYINDNFDYMSKVSKEHYDKRPWAHQDTRDHHIVHQAQRQHDLPRQPSRRCPQYCPDSPHLRLIVMSTDTTNQQALRQREHQEQLHRQRIRERKRAEAHERLKQEHHEEPKPQDISWWTSAQHPRLSSSRSSSCSNHVDDHEHRRQPQEHGANHQQPTWCPCHEEPIYENVHDNSSRRTTTRASRLPNYEMSYHDVTLSPMVSPIPHATTAMAPTRWSHRHEKHSKAHDRHHQRHHEHTQEVQEQPR